LKADSRRRSLELVASRLFRESRDTGSGEPPERLPHGEGRPLGSAICATSTRQTFAGCRSIWSSRKASGVTPPMSCSTTDSVGKSLTLKVTRTWAPPEIAGGKSGQQADYCTDRPSRRLLAHMSLTGGLMSTRRLNAGSGDIGSAARMDDRSPIRAADPSTVALQLGSLSRRSFRVTIRRALRALLVSPRFKATANRLGTSSLATSWDRGCDKAEMAHWLDDRAGPGSEARSLADTPNLRVVLERITRWRHMDDT
jgi:hypothetical protein